MKVLIKSPLIPDFVGDGLMHGIRTLLGEDAIDIPRMHYMYKDCNPDMLKLTGNNGFTLYAKLDDSDRLNSLRANLSNSYNSFDLIIVIKPSCNIEILRELLLLKKANRLKAKVALIDGDDSSRLFPFTNFVYRFLNEFSLVFNRYHDFILFKREFVGFSDLIGITNNKLIGKFLSKVWKIETISMSIPSEVVEHPSCNIKTKDFTEYIVDSDVTKETGKIFSAIREKRYLFHNEIDYYNDIRSSRFGITTKRAGWDCLRHYEYAAKGAVLTFKNFETKANTCAPFGLNSENSISYHSYEDLVAKINAISYSKYEQMQLKMYDWINAYTTDSVASRFLTNLNFSDGK